MTKRAEFGLKTLLKSAYKWCTLVQKWQNVLIFGSKVCFLQTRPLCWKSLKSSVPSAKRTKGAALMSGWKRCFGETPALCFISLESGAPSAKMTKRSDRGLKASVLYKLVHFTKNSTKWYPQCKMRKRADIGLKSSVLYKLAHFTENSKKWIHQCKNEKTCWYRAENAVVYKPYTLLKIICWKSLKSSAPSSKMTKRAYLGLKTLICTNSWALLKIAKEWCAKCKNRKTFWSRAKNRVLEKPVHFARNC